MQQMPMLRKLPPAIFTRKDCTLLRTLPSFSTRRPGLGLKQYVAINWRSASEDEGDEGGDEGEMSEMRSLRSAASQA